ncbi:MAG: Inner membrane CreD family protein [Parcubacteria group bacterium GW2011_GWC2_44_17]|nr:MAG: Inner membrane CreD family protein [Parcubacteria group bacterium GW2011_GWC2_44_17]HCA67681.1 cell envelope integrity protein CreD [Candidatus Jacksonbacteria bacterium]HCE86499.1 cell envelope integrity protein CreD [Candidatus Jacksonbacteria bacterium]
MNQQQLYPDQPQKSALEQYYGSVTLKIFVIVALVLLLQIPVFKIQNLIRERETRRNTAVSEANSQWGGAQTILGPIIHIPYKVFITEEKTVGNQKEVKIREEKKVAHFLPKQLGIASNPSAETRKRGIYTLVFYEDKLNMSGSFNFDFSALAISEENILWNQATLWLSVGDVHGIAEKPLGSGDGGTFELLPVESGFSAPIKLKNGAKSYAFTVDLALKGSEKMLFAPLGEETKVKMKSNWNSPSFTGAFLPDNREILDQGFTAEWNVLSFNRNYKQMWTSSSYTDKPENAENSYFGIEFFQPVNVYQKSMRSVKYNLMFLGLTFAAFFLVEALTKKLKTVHPVQYLLVGAAMILFYLLLLSLSEHIPFIAAYTIASVATIVLITGYIKAMFGRGAVALLLGALLAALHIFLYIALNAEDYALLVGSIGLFLILAIIMYVSRRVNWYELAKK